MIPLTPLLARSILFGLLLVVVAGVVTRQTIVPPPRDEAKAVGDTNLQLWTIERLRSGEPYYAAVGDELRKHSYPTKPIVNWRTPLHYMAVAALSVERAGTLLAALAMAVIVTGSLAYLRYSVARALTAGFFLLAAMAPAILVRPGAVVYPETWAAVFIGLSLNGYAASLPVAGAVLGVLAVFIRELSAPYALVCGLLAMRARRTTEFRVWIAGGALYVLYYGVHAYAASTAIQPGDLVREQSYVRWLGLPFVFMTLYTYGGLAILPPVITPIAAAFGLMGAWAPSAPRQLTISLLLYFGLFCVVGQRFNFYWGFLTCSLWGHAFAHAVEGGTVLLRAAWLRGNRRTGNGESTTGDQEIGSIRRT